MITVRVRLFAMCREAAGAEELSLDLPEGASQEEFWRQLTLTHPALSKFRPQSRIAVNMIYTHGPVTFASGDEIAIIPPVSGG